MFQDWRSTSIIINGGEVAQREEEAGVEQREMERTECGLWQRSNSEQEKEDLSLKN